MAYCKLMQCSSVKKFKIWLSKSKTIEVDLSDFFPLQDFELGKQPLLLTSFYIFNLWNQNHVQLISELYYVYSQNTYNNLLWVCRFLAKNGYPRSGRKKQCHIKHHRSRTEGRCQQKYLINSYLYHHCPALCYF